MSFLWCPLECAQVGKNQNKNTSWQNERKYVKMMIIVNFKKFRSWVENSLENILDKLDNTGAKAAEDRFFDENTRREIRLKVYIKGKRWYFSFLSFSLNLLEDVIICNKTLWNQWQYALQSLFLKTNVRPRTTHFETVAPLLWNLNSRNIFQLWEKFFFSHNHSVTLFWLLNKKVQKLRIHEI